jgi:L-threonylcarbamoyladenylate synthase
MKILKVSPRNFQEAIKEAIKSIKRGKVIVCPTDTVYGLVCDATNKKAVEKIFKIKKRPKRKPLPIFVKDIKMAKRLAEIDKNQEKFLKKVWPGKVTVVLKLRMKKKKIKIYGIDRKTIALRIPNYKFLNNLLKKLNLPLAETSVNISGQSPLIKIKRIINHFKNKKLQPDLIVDGGNLPKSKPSIVIDLGEFPPEILRS